MKLFVLLFLTFFVVALPGTGSAQQHSQAHLKGKITGTVTWEETGDGAELSTVILLQADSIYAGAITDAAGQYSISPIESGRYSIQYWVLGEDRKTIQDVYIAAGETVHYDLEVNLKQPCACGGDPIRTRPPVLDLLGPSGSSFDRKFIQETSK